MISTLSRQHNVTRAAWSALAGTLRVLPASDSGCAPPKLICTPKSNGPVASRRNVSEPFRKITAPARKSCPWMRPATGESGIALVPGDSVQLASLACGATGAGREDGVAGGTALVWGAGGFSGGKILSR